MVKRAFGFTTLLLSTFAITAHGHEEAVIAVQEMPPADPSLYENHVLEVDFYNPFDKVPSLKKLYPLPRFGRSKFSARIDV